MPSYGKLSNNMTRQKKKVNALKKTLDAEQHVKLFDDQIRQKKN